MYKYLSAVALFFCFISSSHSAVLTFEPPPCATCQYGKTSYEESGVLMTGDFAHYGMGTSYANNGTGGALNFGYLSHVRIELTDSGLLSLSSVDLAEYSNVFANIKRTVTFIGTKSDDTTVEQSFLLDGRIDGAGGVADFQTFDFSLDFTDLKFVDIPTYLFSMDNLQFTALPPVVSTVPTPSTLLLFMTGIAGFFFRKKGA